MNNRIISAAVFVLLLATSLALLSCDGRQSQATSSSEPTVSLSPRIALANGDSVPKVEFVRIIVTLDGKSVPFKDTMVDYRLHSLAVPGVPVGSNYRIVAMGLCAAADGRHFPVLWQGSQTGSAKADLGPVLWDNVSVNLKDTTSPSLAASGLPASGDVVLAFGSSLATRTFQVASSDTVYVGTVRISPEDTVSGIATYALRLTKDSTLVVAVVSPRNTVSLRTYRVVVSTDPASDTAKPSITFVHPFGGDTTFTTKQSTYTIEVLPLAASGIDSVVISCGGRRTRLTSAPWKVAVDLDGGSNPVTDTVFASNKKIAFGSATLTNPVSGSDSKPPLVRLVTPSRAFDTVDWDVRTVRLAWKISDSSGVSGAWLQGQISSPVGADSAWSTVQPLKHGKNVFRLVAKDVPGNSDTDSVVVVRRDHQNAPDLVRSQGTHDTLLPAGTRTTYLSWSANDSDGVPAIAVNGVLPGESKNGINVVVAGTADSATIVVNVTFGSADSIEVVLSVRDSSGKEASDKIRLRVAQKPTITRTKPLAASDSVAFDSVYLHPAWIIGRTRGRSTVTLRVNADTAIVSCADTLCTASPGLALRGNLLKLVVRDSAGDSTTDVFSVYRRVDNSAPQLTWKGPNTNRRDTLPMGSTTWQPQWSVVANTALEVAIDGTPATGAASIYGTKVTLRRSARPYDTIVRIVAKASNKTVGDSAILHISGSTIRPVVSVVGSRDVVVSADQTTFQASWTVSDSTLDSVTIDGVRVRAASGVFSRTDSITSKRDTFMIRLVATDSGGLQTFDSIRVRRLRPPVLSKQGGNYATAPTVSISSNLAGASLSWSSDKVNWTLGSTVSVKTSRRLYVKDSLGGVALIDSAIYLLDPVVTMTIDPTTFIKTLTVSDSGADSIEYSLSPISWKRYTGPLPIPQATPFVTRAKLGGKVSATMVEMVNYAPILSPGIDSVYADSVTVTIRSNGLCDSLTYRVNGAATTKTTNCQVPVHLTATSRVEGYSWLGGSGLGGVQTYRISHDTSLTSVSLGAGLPRVTIGTDGVPSVSDTLAFGVRSITIKAETKSPNATVTYNGGTSGVIAVTSDTFTVKIRVENADSFRVYPLKLYSKRVGTLTDIRDGQIYPAAAVGGQVWMAKNLNFPGTESEAIGVCYDLDAANCSKYGRLYGWTEAMGVASVYDSTRLSRSGTEFRGICPEGWHLPSKLEFDTLIAFADAFGGGAGLRSVNWGGVDRWGFAAVGAGAMAKGASLGSYLEVFDWLWSADEYDDTLSSAIQINSEAEGGNAFGMIQFKKFQYSIRCVMNSR